MSRFDGPALGLIELSSLARGLRVCDAMVKRAPIRVLRSTSIHPGKYVVIVTGGVDEVTEALKTGRTGAGDAFVDLLNLPYPHQDLLSIIDTPRRLTQAAMGLIECYSVAATLRAADAALKAAAVRPSRIVLADHIGGKGFFVFSGELHDVQAAMEAGVHQVGAGLLAGQEVIAHPHEDFLAALATTDDSLTRSS
ncbi:MAG: BMC domain-containing protein [Myxococcota bacterium]|nr:BMC domain-containing protein [Myxococcota bacterium]